MSTLNVKPEGGNPVPATQAQLDDLRKQIALVQAQVAALGVGVVGIRRDLERGQVPIDLDGNDLDCANLDNTSAPTLGETLGAALSQLEQAARYVNGTPNQIIITLDQGTATFALPQSIAETDTPTWARVYAKKLSGDNDATPVIALGPGAGTGATVTLAVGSDLMFRVDITTGTGCVSAGSIFTAQFSAPYTAPPFAVVSPTNRKAWDQQNTANKACAVNLATSTGAVLDFQAGTTALTDATSYSWTFFIGARV